LVSPGVGHQGTAGGTEDIGLEVTGHGGVPRDVRELNALVGEPVDFFAAFVAVDGRNR
jgi:hypothetical protein